MTVLPVLFLVTAAAISTALPGKLPFLPDGFKNGSSFVDAIDKAAALARFNRSVGHDVLENLKKAIHRPTGRMRHIITPGANEESFAHNVLAGDTVIDKPSIAVINQPIAAFLSGGDVMMAPELSEESEGVRAKRGAPVYTSRRWNKNTPIAFVFNADITESTRALIRKATQKIAANTCLSFQENGSGTQLQFHRGGGCWSYIGNALQGKQPISIDNGCEYIGIISHEITHALGIDHTQNRKDRDGFVSINTGAVPSDIVHNFAKLSEAANENFGVPYEYGSDMHYGAYDFSTNSQAVVVAREKDYTNSMGQRKYLTFNDYKLINALYACNGGCSNRLVCQNSGYQSPKNCNVCVCNDFYMGANCETPRAEVRVSAGSPVSTVFHQDYSPSLYTSGNNYNWDMFGKDSPKIITAPTGRRIKVTINQVYAAYGQLSCYLGCPFVGLEFVDNAGGDLTTLGKLFCCTKDQGYSFISKSNVIGYKAYASPGMPFDAKVTYSVE